MARGVATVGGVIRYVIFARMLPPRDFGILGAAVFVSELLFALTDPRLNSALVQQDEEVEPFLDTAWVASMARGLAVASVLIFASDFFVDYFNVEQARGAFWIMALVTILRSGQSPALVSLGRRFEFHVLAIINTAEMLGSLTSGIIGILYWHDWRGLLFSAFVGQAVRTFLTYWYYPYFPQIRFKLPQFKRMFSFGRWEMASGIANFAARQLDNFVVAHVLGPEALGVYQMAFRAGELPADEFACSVAHLSFPFAARMRNRRRQCWTILTIANLTVIVLGFGYTLVIFGWGPTLVDRLLGANWHNVTQPLKLFCVYGLIQGFLNVNRSFMEGMGRPWNAFSITAIRAIVLALTIYPLTVRYQTIGAAVAGLLSVTVPVPVIIASCYRTVWGCEPSLIAAERSIEKGGRAAT